MNYLFQQCMYIKNDGERCRRETHKGYNYCTQHTNKLLVEMDMEPITKYKGKKTKKSVANQILRQHALIQQQPLQQFNPYVNPLNPINPLVQQQFNPYVNPLVQQQQLLQNNYYRQPTNPLLHQNIYSNPRDPRVLQYCTNLLNSQVSNPADERAALIAKLGNDPLYAMLPIEELRELAK